MNKNQTNNQTDNLYQSSELVSVKGDNEMDKNQYQNQPFVIYKNVSHQKLKKHKNLQIQAPLVQDEGGIKIVNPILSSKNNENRSQGSVKK